ncbi:MAG TPA: sigma factor-like helix-turn-helix DNA-binding protein [Kofleriaceae bacterium]
MSQTSPETARTGVAHERRGREKARGQRPERTLEEVAATLNVTRERVRQLEARGLTALRRARRRLT